MADNLIRRILDVTGWTRTGLARRVGVHKDTVHEWIHKGRHPRSGIYIMLESELSELQAEITSLLQQLKRAGGGQNDG